MDFIARILVYNWRHYAVSVVVFVAFWQVFSAFSAVRVADDKLLTALVGKNRTDFQPNLRCILGKIP